MGTITTTSYADPLRYPSSPMIERENFDGDLWFAKRVSATQVDIYKSASNGATWSGPIASFTRANLQETSGIYMDSNGHLHMLVRVYESGTDRIYYYRLGANNTGFDTEQFVVGASAASAGLVYTGMDLIVMKLSSTYYVHMAVGTHNGTSGGVTIFSATVTLGTGTTFTMRNTLISGYRQWLNGPDGIVHPTIDFMHTGDGKTPSSTPNLWVVWGRSTFYTARLTYNTGPSWVSPDTNTPSAVSSLSPSQDYNAGVWDAHGSRFVIAFPNSNVVRLAERSVDNSTQAQRDTPTHPNGVVKYCSLSVSSATSNVRVYGVGTSANTLYFVDYDRDGNTWGSWTQVSASAIIGTVPNNWTNRRVNFGNGHFDNVVATGSSPYNLISTSTTAASAPKTPVISTPTNGQPADVNAALTISWSFVDDDPSDFQNAYSLRRSIGGGTFNYWNASTSSWSTTDVFNASGTTSVTLASGWGADSDATHAYSVKVQDQQLNSSPNATNVQVTPSAKFNPTITSPSASPTSATITVSWTVGSQSAYRIILQVTSTNAVVRDTGWVTGTGTSVTLPDTLLAQGYTLTLTTRNAEGLTSNTATLNFTPSFTPPQSATPTLTPLSTLGVIRTTLTNLDPVGAEATNQSNTIYRRKIGDTGSGVKVATIGVSAAANLVAAFFKSFEETNSSDSWGTAGGASSASRDTSQAHSGLACFAETAIGTGAGFAGINFGPLNQFSASPGDTFYLEFWAKGTVGRVVKGQVGWRTAANGPNNVPSTGATLTMTGAWQKYTMTSGAAPSNTAFAYPTLGVSTDNTTTAGEKLYIDDVVYYKTGATPSILTYDDFMAASGVAYEYSVVTTAVNGSVTQSAWFS